MTRRKQRRQRRLYNANRRSVSKWMRRNAVPRYEVAAPGLVRAWIRVWAS